VAPSSLRSPLRSGIIRPAPTLARFCRFCGARTPTSRCRIALCTIRRSASPLLRRSHSASLRGLPWSANGSAELAEVYEPPADGG